MNINPKSISKKSTDSLLDDDEIIAVCEDVEEEIFEQIEVQEIRETPSPYHERYILKNLQLKLKSNFDNLNFL